MRTICQDIKEKPKETLLRFLVLGFIGAIFGGLYWVRRDSSGFTEHGSDNLGVGDSSTKDINTTLEDYNVSLGNELPQLNNTMNRTELLKFFKCTWSAEPGCGNHSAQKFCPAIEVSYGALELKAGRAGLKLFDLGMQAGLLRTLIGAVELLCAFLDTGEAMNIIGDFVQAAVEMAIDLPENNDDHKAEKASESVRTMLGLPDFVPLPAPDKLQAWIDNPEKEIEGLITEKMMDTFGPAIEEFLGEINPNHPGTKIAVKILKKGQEQMEAQLKKLKQTADQVLKYAKEDRDKEWAKILSVTKVSMDLMNTMFDACKCKDGCEEARRDCSGNLILGSRPGFIIRILNSAGMGDPSECVDLWRPALWDLDIQFCTAEYNINIFRHFPWGGGCPYWASTAHWPAGIWGGCSCSSGWKVASWAPSGDTTVDVGAVKAFHHVNWFSWLPCQRGDCEKCTSFQKHAGEISKNGEITDEGLRLVDLWDDDANFTSEQSGFTMGSAVSFVTLAVLTISGCAVLRCRKSRLRPAVSLYFPVNQVGE